MAKEALKARGIFPSLTVSDIAASRRFYVDGLGFSVRDEWKDDKGTVMGYMLNAGGASSGLGIGQDDFAKGRDRVKGIGIRLWIETDQDLAAIASGVKAAGFALDSEPAKLQWGKMAFAVTDPDGYKLTVTEPNG
jgi:catechol 2,3-dioxygenase-like lactoylglutathione lyase family enzyme